MNARNLVFGDNCGALHKVKVDICFVERFSWPPEGTDLQGHLPGTPLRFEGQYTGCFGAPKALSQWPL